ncbi:MAG TPA: hypothetical protein VKF82_11540 [Candidatus Eremiobacteraceae bacterium]|nr:hypothetical protein [Candidatus Eremiobacteraceae bacterium]
MRATVKVVRNSVRLIFVALLILGILLWTNVAPKLLDAHVTLGILLVLGLWITCTIAAAARVSLGLVAAGAIWGIIVVALGMTQISLLRDSMHWIVQVTHLLVGIAALALNERLAGQTLEQLPAAS